jgi:hypothetical protein
MEKQQRVGQVTSCLGLSGHDCLFFKRLRELNDMIKRKIAAKKPVEVLCFVRWSGNELFGSAEKDHT